MIFNVDYEQMGLGGDDSWARGPHPQYTLLGKAPFLFVPAPGILFKKGIARITRQALPPLIAGLYLAARGAPLSVGCAKPTRMLAWVPVVRFLRYFAFVLS